MKTIIRNNMRRSLKLITVSIIALFTITFNQSCTKLDEELYDSVTPANFFTTQEEFISALGAAYTRFADWATSDGTMALQEVTTDEMVVPTRGQDWDDGGNWRRLHLHSWTREDYQMNNGWDFGFSGVNTANRLIYQFQSLVTGGQVSQAAADAFIAELETVRGFFYWQLIDMFGNVPLVTDFASTESAPATKSRLEVYNFVIGNLEAAVPKLSKAVDGTTYGRMNYYAGQALLAKLYLNAGVYTGTNQWTKAIAACNEIINSGKYSLESNFFANFNVNNSGSKEFIFAIPYDEVFFQGFQYGVKSLHYGSQDTYNFTAQPWNGFCSLEEFYKSYSDADVRKGDAGTVTAPATKRGTFLAGYQYKNGGGKVMDDGFEVPQPNRVPPLLGDPDGAPLNFGNIGSTQAQINELGPQAYRQSGVRIGKWEYALGAQPQNMSNDYGVFRYADILLMKAEALFRTGNTAEALILVNQIRARAGVPALTSLDGPLSYDMTGPVVPGGELFNEIGRELAFENHKRTNLIRWGFFLDVSKWALPFYNPGDRLEAGVKTKLFPVHKDKIAANPNLVQNPGY
ncbi:MAG TPA: RagB/SusD family nutrient uptake outer membrane protein [Bacteroidales bacterium]|jgi:starch-binding outer membrane protein, SusD/RagB family|nr:RagB/SusD family nutrient uptake outer membrane protein [Bacteroidales bacterium]